MNDSLRLTQLYEEIKQVILSRQNPVTGLLPASTDINSHGDYTDAWVRDNVYSIVGPWALSIALGRSGDKRKQDELEQATIKLMRGLLKSMMYQSDKVEKFKQSVDPLDALHAKYKTSTGLPVVADDAWGHLQIDATSLFLLMLAQMTASGLRIILTYDEVDFIQNLIYYISAAYRIADYGIWERGNKINNGKTEINASSLGMAKSAMIALDGLNLFGNRSDSRAKVHIVPDSISLARTTLASLLPRESLSKEVDSALLSIIGFPAFAVGDKAVINKTRDEILSKLGGNYGCKRFLWDGHQTELEDPTRLYYEHSELANFEHVESQWPLFFCYLYIDALFNDDFELAGQYREKIESVAVEKDGVKLIPELYYLPKENIAAEKENPNSQTRVPNDNVPLVWAQSIYYAGLLIEENYILSSDLDKIDLRKKTTNAMQTQVALIVLAENESVKQTLAENGVIAESIEEIAPIKVITAPHLVDAYEKVGANAKLNISGRPHRRMRSLATSQTYNIDGEQCLCLSWLQSVGADYRMCDPSLVSDKLMNEIDHIRKHWLNDEAAVFTFMVTEELAQSPTVRLLYHTLRTIQLRHFDQNVGYASASLAYRASRKKVLVTPQHYLVSMRSRTAGPVELAGAPTEIQELIHFAESDQRKAYETLKLLAGDKSPWGEDQKVHLLELIYKISKVRGHWLLARQSFILSGKNQVSLVDYLKTLAARSLSVLAGLPKAKECVVGTSDAQAVLSTLKEASSSDIEYCLLQEMLASIGTLERTQPQLFEGLRSIHLHNMLKLCVQSGKSTWSEASAIDVASMSPSDILNRVDAILSSQHDIFTQGLSQSFSLKTVNVDDGGDIVDTDWFEWRAERGLIVNFDRDFLEKTWNSLAHVKTLVFGDVDSSECVIDCELVRSSMTSREEMFAKLIDDSIQQIHPAYYKTAIIETLLAYIHFCEKNKQVFFEGKLNLSEQLEISAKDFCKKNKKSKALSRDIDLFLREPPKNVQAHLAKAFESLINRKVKV